jgi:cell wall-associated NlpC family hydrolase
MGEPARQAVVAVALTPVRAEPASDAEQTSQALLGEPLAVLDRTDDWARCRSEDGHEGWVSAGALAAEEADPSPSRPADHEPAIALDGVIGGADGRPLARLPWGAVVLAAGDDVLLPGGVRGRMAGGELVRLAALPERFPARGEAVVDTARQWTGVPYLWGGRTRWGADCSGFVQAVYRLHGVGLPRDSYQQAAVGPAIDTSDGLDALQPGDLLFFRARDGERVVHVAMSMGGSRVLHAAERNGSIRENDLRGGDELERSLAGRLSVARRPLA